MATAIDLPARADVAIVGGGFAGAATAWALAERGVRAVILEREPALGRHASGRGAGLGRQLAEDDATSRLAIRGAELLRRRFPSAWRQTGGLLGFDDPAHAAAYQARAERLGVPHEVVGRAAVLRHWPAFAELPVAAAVAVPTDGVIDPRALLAGLAAGAEVVHAAPVVRISDGWAGAGAEAGGVVLETPRGALAARVVVDAAGAWAGIATGDPPLDVHRRHLFVLEAAAPAGAPYFWHLGADELYVRADGDGLLACPCDAEATAPADQQPTPAGDACLAARLAAAPGLAGARIVRRWACQRAFTPDRRMRLGRDPDRPWLVWAAGLGGHGATAAAAVGEVVAGAVLEALGRGQGQAGG
jgi:glycine/D-amino acid oxidase-like deaminating enzyme